MPLGARPCFLTNSTLASGPATVVFGDVSSHRSELFDYALPEHLIAQTPAARRDQSKLLVVNRAEKKIAHHVFADLPRFLHSGDVLFRNNARVLPARLHAVRPTGGVVECFLLHSASEPSVWQCLVKPGKKLPVGAGFDHPNGDFHGEIVSKNPDRSEERRVGKECRSRWSPY